jgi:transposase
MGNFLSKLERKQLEQAHSQESSLRYGDRIKAVLLLDSKWEVHKIAEALLLDPNTIRRYKELFESGGIERLCSDNYLGRDSRLTKDQEEILKKQLRCQIYLCTTEIIDFVTKEFKVEYSQSGMTYLLHRLGFSYKKPNLVPGKANEENQRLFLAELETLRSKKKPEDKLFYVDGVHP